MLWTNGQRTRVAESVQSDTFSNRVVVLRLYPQLQSELWMCAEVTPTLFARPPSYTFLLWFRGRRTRGRVRASLAQMSKASPEGSGGDLDPLKCSQREKYFAFGNSGPRPMTHGQVRGTSAEDHVSNRSSVPVHLSWGPRCTRGTDGDAAPAANRQRGEHASLAWHEPGIFCSVRTERCSVCTDSCSVCTERCSDCTELFLPKNTYTPPPFSPPHPPHARHGVDGQSPSSRRPKSTTRRSLGTPRYYCSRPWSTPKQQ